MITYIDKEYIVFDDLYLYKIDSVNHKLIKINAIKEHSDKNTLVFNDTMNKIVLTVNTSPEINDVNITECSTFGSIYNFIVKRLF